MPELKGGLGVLDIMLPYWGDPKYLHAAVDSICAQDADQWRLTIIDDHYPDESAADHYRQLDDPRIRFIRNDRNLGLAANFQRCLDLAEAEYVMFMGSDDLLEPGYVRAITQMLQLNDDVHIVQPGVRVIDGNGKNYLSAADIAKRLLRPRASASRLRSGEPLACSLLHGDWLYWPSLAFRTKTIKQVRFREEYSMILDLGIVLDLVVRGARLVVLEDEVFCYRRHRASASAVALHDGVRFAEDRNFFARQTIRMRELGWRRAARAARLRITSRGHALALLPKAIVQRDWGWIRTLLHHISA